MTRRAAPYIAAKETPAWDAAGQPTNLAGAAEDARDWLTVFRDAPHVAAWLQRNGDAFERLERTIAAVERFVEKAVVKLPDGEEAERV